MGRFPKDCLVLWFKRKKSLPGWLAIALDAKAIRYVHAEAAAGSRPRVFAYAETPEQAWEQCVKGGVLTRWLQEQHTT